VQRQYFFGCACERMAEAALVAEHHIVASQIQGMTNAELDRTPGIVMMFVNAGRVIQPGGAMSQPI